MVSTDSPTAPDDDASLSAIARQLSGALIALDFDGTLAPIVVDPEQSRPVPGVIDTLADLARAGARIAVITGRDALTAVRLGRLDRVGGIVVSGLHGAEQWRSGVLRTRDEPAGLTAVRAELPGLLPSDVWLEDKRLSLVVHTRRAAEPERSLAELAGPVAELAERNGLRSHPGKLVLEIRIPDLSKATALGELLDDDAAALYAGDDLGDLPAVAEVRAWAARTGRPALTIAVGEVAELRAAADRAVASPAALAALLVGLLSRA